jgi:hypothetical protein
MIYIYIYIYIYTKFHDDRLGSLSNITVIIVTILEAVIFYTVDLSVIRSMPLRWLRVK